MTTFTSFPPISEESEQEDVEGSAYKPSSIGLPRPLLKNENSSFCPPSTPNTYLTLGEVALKPDLSLYCPDCDQHTAMSHLLEHRLYHAGLKTLNFNPKQPPKHVKEISARRKELLQDQKTNSDLVRRLNEAHDAVKAYIEKPTDVERNELEELRIEKFVTGTALDCSCECVLAVGICSDENGAYRSSMEDRRVYQDYFGNDESKTFLGLYDGYNGCFAAEVAANEMHHVLLQELIRFDPKTTCTCAVNMVTDEASSDYDENRPYTRSSERIALHYESTNMVQSIIHTCEQNMENLDKKFKASGSVSSPFSTLMSTAFTKSFYEVDRYLTYGMDEHSRVRWSGCSALTVLIKDVEDDWQAADLENNEDEAIVLNKLGDIHLAQAGEIRAILVRSGKAYRLTKEHSLRNKKERNRIIKSGGNVTGTGKKDVRVNGVLSSTRGLGNHGDPSVKKFVKVDPHTSTVQIDQYAEFLILVTRGIWDVFSDDEAATIVGQLLPKNLLPLPSRPNTSLLSLLGLQQSIRQGQSDLDRAISADLDQADDLGSEKDDLENALEENERADQDKNSRPDTGKSSRVSFNLDNAEFESAVDYSEIRSVSSLMPDELARGQLRRDFAKEMSERLVHAAIMAGAKDNITAMVVLFPGSGV